MGKSEKQLKKIIEKCKILYKDQCISEPPILQAYIRYLSLAHRRDEHNVGVILHTPSICFDVLAITFSAIINLISNETSTGDFLESLSEGTMVLYKGEKKIERYRYEGREIRKGKEYIKLSQNKKDGKENKFIPQESWTRITPYNGTSTREDGCGISSKNNDSITNFYTKVLELQKSDIPNVFDTSSIIVTSKEKSTIVKDIFLKFDEEKIALTNLITAAYYSDADTVFNIGDNPGKTEALLKFVSKVSTARGLMRSKDGNNHLGVMILGDQIIHKSETELPGLMNRKNLKYVFISAEKNSCFIQSILQDNKNIALFACTKRFVQKYPCDSRFNPLLAQLSFQIDDIVNKTITPIVIEDSMLNWNLYSSVKKALSIIYNNEYSSDEKDYFIWYSSSLLKIFVSAIFPISELEKNNIDTNHITIKERIEELKKIEIRFPSILREKSSYIINTLEALFKYFFVQNDKLKILEKIIMENRKKRIAIIVSKKYYLSILDKYALFNDNRIKIFTHNTFPKEYFDIVVLTSFVITSKFDPLSSYNLRFCIPILYEHEDKYYKYEKSKYNELNNFLNSRLTIRSKSFLIPEKEEDLCTEDVTKVHEINESLNTYISEIDLNIQIKHFSINQHGKSNLCTKVHKAIIFTDGSRALFTEHYRAYVFDSDEENISEKNINDLTEGDCLVFTNKNNETKDIVDIILKHLIEENILQCTTIEAYKKSKKWKQNLHDFVIDNKMTVRQLYKLPKERNLNVTEATIRMWMDEDSHIVGPREIESIQRVAILTNDDEMFQNAGQYYEACAEVRKLRRNIMDKMAQAIMDKLINKTSNSDLIAKTVYDRVDNLSQLLEIETIVPYEKEVPIHMTNKPLEF